jgi:hypothetical protein
MYTKKRYMVSMLPIPDCYTYDLKSGVGTKCRPCKMFLIENIIDLASS